MHEISVNVTQSALLLLRVEIIPRVLTFFHAFLHCSCKLFQMLWDRKNFSSQTQTWTGLLAGGAAVGILGKNILLMAPF